MQISEELFIALLKYHLVEIDDVLPEIKKGLEEKLEADLSVCGCFVFKFKEEVTKATKYLTSALDG